MPLNKETKPNLKCFPYVIYASQTYTYQNIAKPFIHIRVGLNQLIMNNFFV